MIKRPLACPTTHIFLSPLPLWILHRQLDLNYLKVKFQASTCRDGHAWVGNNDVMFVRKLVSLQDVSNLVAIDACYKEKGPSCIETTERLSLEGHVAPTFCPFPHPTRIGIWIWHRTLSVKALSGLCFWSKVNVLIIIWTQGRYRTGCGGLMTLQELLWSPLEDLSRHICKWSDRMILWSPWGVWGGS